MTDRLPSWKPGPVRDAVEAFLDAAVDVPVPERFACFDNDGTLWCEKPNYVQLDFFVGELARRVDEDPSVGERPELAAVLSGDRAAMAEIGLPAIALALAGLFEGLSPEEFTARCRAFFRSGRNEALDRPYASCTYAPMLELVAELRRLDFTVAIVTGGGTEFVRAISPELYAVAPELVVGTLVSYEYGRVDGDGAPFLRRTAGISGGANEGDVKVSNIQTQLGRRPILAAGNSAGDREMLEWAAAGPGPTLALLVDHDDAEREFAYESVAGSFETTDSITDIGASLGWTVVSMARDWETVFSPG